jgi:putative pyruvate formate lyase activating enzyme
LLQLAVQSALAKHKLALSRLPQALSLLNPCRACPRHCAVNRLAGETGFCRIGRHPRVASVSKHFGEEPCLVGKGGSGTIFFAGCNLRCAFCQNHPISRGNRGDEMTPAELAEQMLELQRRGAENINLVTPSHVGVQILEALAIAWQEGLALPVVWNSGGYDEPELLELLDGLVDIYMPDAKYDDPAVAERLSGVYDYVAVNRQALRIMHRQVGDLVLDENGLATQGLLVRHLVLPGDLSGTAAVMRFLAGLSPDTATSLMSQYHPAGGEKLPAPLDRMLTNAEYKAAVRACHAAGLSRGYLQGLDIEPEEFGIKRILENDLRDEKTIGG